MNKMKHSGIFDRRGFNLIEISIVVVVLGILGSAVLVPISAILLEEQYDREKVAIERARQAVIGYAARSATPGALIQLNGMTDANRRFEVPAGRAYFPCPDITGDGNEDRNHYDEDIGFRLMPSVPTLTVAADGIVHLRELNATPRVAGGGSVSPDNSMDLRTTGSCSSMRGFLPWKTLGLPPTDTWGNLRTYAVDSLYSHSIAGFNQNTIADQFVAHDFIDPANEAFRERGGSIVGRIGTNDTLNLNAPIALCLGVESICDPANNFVNLTLAYGRVPGATGSARRPYAANDIVNGLIFVIVSHGRNGFGAGQYRGPAAVACNHSITDAANHENANYPFVLNPSAGAITNANCRSQGTPPRGVSYFTTLRRNNVGDRTFDDVMVWATREQINEVITRNSPDLPLYVVPPAGP